MVRYVRRRPADAKLRERIRDLASQRRRFCYRRLYALVCRKGWALNHKKYRRLFREQRLQVRRRGSRKRALGARAHMTIITGSTSAMAILRWSNERNVEGTTLRQASPNRTGLSRASTRGSRTSFQTRTSYPASLMPIRSWKLCGKTIQPLPALLEPREPNPGRGEGGTNWQTVLGTCPQDGCCHHGQRWASKRAKALLVINRAFGRKQQSSASSTIRLWEVI